MTTSADYAELAAIFTTVDEPADDRSYIDLLLLGHLPVQGNLWSIPYVGRELQGGSGVLIRIHEEAVDFVVVGDCETDISQCETLEDALDRVGSSIKSWMVQPPSDADANSLLHSNADRITLLSGADQAAVVGAYRLLKGVVLASGGDVSAPAMNLVIVGTAERAAKDAANRIVQTAHHQLGVQLSVGQSLPTMGSASRIASQATFQHTGSVAEIINRIRLASQSMPTELTEPSIPLTDRPVSEMEEDVVETLVHNEDYANLKPTTEHAEGSLASHLEGLIGMKPRCPNHESVELAIDTQGRLHLLANVEDFRSAAVVASWAVQHHALISMACGGVEVDATITPKQHIFTSDAASIVDLHGTDFALHLLAEVEVEGHRGLFCTPLN